MDILIFNFSWMMWNSFLAVLPVMFGFGMMTMKRKVLKLAYFWLWLLFVPNTIYVITDLAHIYNLDQLFKINFYLIPLLVIEYLLLLIVGLATYIYSLYYFEKTLQQLTFSQTVRQTAIILLNFLISFGVMLGRFQRTNSWEVITHPFKVLNDILATFFTTEHLLYTLVFGFFCSLLYYGIRRKMT